MRSEKTKRVALLGLLFALSAVFSFLESMLTPFLGLPPGIKLGLANVVVMAALLFLRRQDAVILIVLKSLFVLLTRGISAAALSLGGGGLSLLVMIIISLGKSRPSLFILSVSGAVAHNIGQLLIVRFFMTHSMYTFYYLPVLLVSGLAMGSITAAVMKMLIPPLERIGLKKD